MNRTTKRIAWDVVIIIGAFILNPWLVLILGIAGLFFFDNYYEILVAGFIVDVLYGIQSRFIPIPVLYTALAMFFLAAASGLKKHLKFYFE